MSWQVLLKQTFQPEEISAIAKLEQLCNDRDQLQMDVGTESLVNRPTDGTWDLICYSEGQLVGYCSCTTFDSEVVEIIAMVHPDYRQQGIFRAMLTAAEAELQQLGSPKYLFIVPGGSHAAMKLMDKLGATYRESEFTMRWNGTFPPYKPHPELHLREALPADFEFLVQCSAQAFGDSPEAVRTLLHRTQSPNRTTYLAMQVDTPIGMIRTYRAGDRYVSIHGFSVLPDYQGHGYGRQILLETVKRMQEAGRTQIELDVVTENARGLHLYQTCGFDVRSESQFFEKSN